MQQKHRDTEKKTDLAVSPVVGVMLILAVTIIVAAVVAAFAGGIVGSAEPAPTAAFNFKIHAGGGIGSGTIWTQPGVECSIPVSTGDFSSNDLKITVSYTVPDTYNGVHLSNAGKTITTTTTGRVQDYGLDLSSLGTTAQLPDTVGGVPLPYYDSTNDPFESHTYLCKIHIIPTSGNGLTVGPGQNEQKFFGGNTLVGGGTLWWFKDVDAFLGFPVKDRSTYGFNENSVVHITVTHIPTGTVLSDQDVKAVW